MALDRKFREVFRESPVSNLKKIYIERFGHRC